MEITYGSPLYGALQLLFIAFLIFVSLVLLYWYCHYSLSKNDLSCVYGYGNFKDFIREFNGYIWEAHDKTEGRFRGLYKETGYYNNGYYISGDTIQFDNKLMILDPVSFVRYKVYIKREWRKRVGIQERRNVVKWH